VGGVAILYIGRGVISRGIDVELPNVVSILGLTVMSRGTSSVGDAVMFFGEAVMSRGVKVTSTGVIGLVSAPEPEELVLLDLVRKTCVSGIRDNDMWS
jgi:hypothetical protein